MAEQAICSAAALPAGGRTGNLLWRRSGAYGRTGNLLWRRSGAYGRTGNLLCYPLCRLWQNRQFALPPPLPRFELNIKLKIPSAAALPAAGRTGNLLCRLLAEQAICSASALPCRAYEWIFNFILSSKRGRACKSVYPLQGQESRAKEAFCRAK